MRRIPARSIKFLQDNKQIVYAIALMIVIPGAVIFNTLLFSDSFKKTIDQTLQNKAIGMGEVIEASLADKYDSPGLIQELVNNLSVYNSDISSIDILNYDHMNQLFKVLASSDAGRLNQTGNLMVYTVAWNKDWPSAQKVVEPTGESGKFKTYWLVVMPLKDNAGVKQALLSMKVQTDIIDNIIKSVLQRSYWLLIAIVLIIVLLLLVNSRLFEHAMLYHKIKEVDEMKDEFISMASHELKTPITVIQGYTTMILDDTTGQLQINDKVRESLKMMNESSDRLRSLIEDLLNVSRIEQGRLKMDVAPTDVWPLIEQTVKELTVQADAKKLVLKCAKAEGVPTRLIVDKDRFRQALINIIGNAVKYTEKGSVEVTAVVRDGKRLAIIIKDTGIGMAAKDREHLFEKFYRVHNEKTAQISGTGLGLWITKQIVELMAGEILIDSIENVGTQITLEFPLAGSKGL